MMIREYVSWAIITIFSLFFAFDIVSDLKEGSTSTHLFIELFFFSISFIFSIFLTTNYYKFKKKSISLAADLTSSQKIAQDFRNKNAIYLNGLSDAIDKQFIEWNLTAAEKDIALLLIKGISLREISELRKSTESTVRSQSASIYEKSRLAGRAELAAFFLEDLFQPQTMIKS